VEHATELRVWLTWKMGQNNLHMVIKNIFLLEISGFHGDEDKDGCLVHCWAV
jgi:hypothetical protein